LWVGSRTPLHGFLNVYVPLLLTPPHTSRIYLVTLPTHQLCVPRGKDFFHPMLPVHTLRFSDFPPTARVGPCTLSKMSLDPDAPPPVTTECNFLPEFFTVRLLTQFYLGMSRMSDCPEITKEEESVRLTCIFFMIVSCSLPCSPPFPRAQTDASLLTRLFQTLNICSGGSCFDVTKTFFASFTLLGGAIFSLCHNSSFLHKPWPVPVFLFDDPPHLVTFEIPHFPRGVLAFRPPSFP